MMMPMRTNIGMPAGGMLGGIRRPPTGIGAGFGGPQGPQPIATPGQAGPFQMNGNQLGHAPIATPDPARMGPVLGSYDNLKRPTRIKHSGLYKLKAGEGVTPLKSLAHAK